MHFWSQKLTVWYRYDIISVSDTKEQQVCGVFACVILWVAVTTKTRMTILYYVITQPFATITQPWQIEICLSK